MPFSRHMTFACHYVERSFIDTIDAAAAPPRFDDIF